jgi:uncharacterized protein YegL
MEEKMAQNDFSAKSPENYEQKCLCVLALDISGSMSGTPIRQLNQGLQDFYNEVKNDKTTADRLEFSIVTFHSEVENVLDPSLVDNFTMPSLEASGSTKLVDGVREAISTAEARKSWYKETGQPYYRPWIILISDGAPDSDQDVNGLSKEIQIGTENKSFFFFAVGVEGADMDVLSQISSSQMPPAPLEGLKFTEFFKWLSDSMTMVTSSQDGEQIDLPSPADWMQGFTI